MTDVKWLGRKATPKNKQYYRFRSLVRSLPRPFGKATWSELSHSLKLALAIVPPTIVGFAIPLFRRQPIKHYIPSVIAAIGHSVGLVGVKDMHEELTKNLGVKLTLPRTYQFLSTFGSFINTVGQLKFMTTGVGRVFFGFNLLVTCVYAYMLYLTLIYNRTLDSPTQNFEQSLTTTRRRYTVNVPALVGWFACVLITFYIWIDEGRKSLTSTYKNEVLAAIGFLMMSIGNMRAGFRAAMTSVPELTPFVGAATSALASLLSGLALIPYWSKSPIARIYLAGYASVVYSTILNAFYALKLERQKWKTRRRQANTSPVFVAKL